MRVLYFGTYDRAYPRNAQVISALRGAGVEVREQHRAVWERRHNWSVGLRQMLRVAEAERSLRRVARRRARRRRADRRLSRALRPAGRQARRARAARRLQSARLALRHARRRPRALPARLARRRGRPPRRPAGLPPRRPRRRRHRGPRRVLPRASSASPRTGSRSASSARRTASSSPGWQPEAPFHALFVGKLIPLHGLETILAAAALAPEIPFRVVGSGQLEPLLDDRPANVEWIPWVEYEDLPGRDPVRGLRARHLRNRAPRRRA